MASSETIAAVLAGKSAQLWSVPPSATVYEAIELMAEKEVGALLVMSSDRLLGIISERDYARKVILQERSSKRTLVYEIMTSPVLTVTPNDTVEECMNIMTDRKIRHLPVMQGSRVSGIVTIGDLVKAIISRHEHVIEHLQAYIAGSYPS